MNAQVSCTAKNQRGVLLLEVMVAGMLLVIGVTGLGAAQIASLRSMTHSDTTTRLLYLHASILDRLRLHRAAAVVGDLDLEVPRDTPFESIGLTVPEFHDLGQALLFGNAPAYLKVLCADRSDASCEVCVGTYSTAEDRDRSDAGEPPVNAICSTQRIG